PFGQYGHLHQRRLRHRLRHPVPHGGFRPLLKFFVGHTDSTEHQAIAAQRFNRVDSHTTHQFFDFMPPGIHQIDKTLTARIGGEALYKFG
uniref:hypothetical protein n=1 Tax=Dubosiella newyorkensis TaxID=1862672 RepID=UPI002729AA6A